MWRTSDEWEKIIKEAYTSDLPLKRWCLEHNIKDITFRKARERLLREGKLRFMEEKVLLPIDESRKWVRLPSENIRAILVLEPIRGNLSMESMASIIAFDLDLPLIPGQIFFFIEKKWKQIYALKICKNGYCLSAESSNTEHFTGQNLTVTPVISCTDMNMTGFSKPLKINMEGSLKPWNSP